jgi:hypothetical protein
VTWLAVHWLDILGWGGSALLVYSLLQSRVLRFRVLNLAACVILVIFNGLLGIWPMVAMNLVLCTINVWFIVRLTRDRHSEAAFEVLEVRPDDEYLRHVLRVHGADFLWDPGEENAYAFLVQKGDETVGVVLVHRAGETAHVVLDYVTPRFRDFSPGEFVWRRSGLLTDHGVSRVVTSPVMVGPYYDRVGFHREGDAWARAL